MRPLLDNVQKKDVFFLIASLPRFRTTQDRGRNSSQVITAQERGRDSSHIRTAQDRGATSRCCMAPPAGDAGFPSLISESRHRAACQDGCHSAPGQDEISDSYTCCSCSHTSDRGRGAAWIPLGRPEHGHVSFQFTPQFTPHENVV